jgi:stage V sporulation protein G
VTLRPDGRFFIIQTNLKEENSMAKTQTKAAEPAASEQTSSQSPFPFDVRIYGAKDNGTQRATATVNIGGIFAVRGIKVLEGSKGLFISMPQYKVGNEYKDICFPCTKESHEQLNSAVMSAYEQALTQKQTQSEAPVPQQAPAMSGQSM